MPTLYDFGLCRIVACPRVSGMFWIERDVDIPGIEPLFFGKIDDCGTVWGIVTDGVDYWRVAHEVGYVSATNRWRMGIQEPQTQLIDDWIKDYMISGIKEFSGWGEI